VAAEASAAEFFRVQYFDFFRRKGATAMNVLKPHVSLNVSDIEAAVAFYEKVFDVPVTKRRPGYAKFDLATPSLNLSMQEAPRSGVNASHFGIQVASTEDVALATARFQRHGLRTLAEEDTSCCYAVQDKVWVEDPDGNVWEVFVVKSDSPDMRTDQTACCAPPSLASQDSLVPLGAKRGCC
jgi:catechol 2,3-dioxygenase-like lactoylglutathione lyase family enzyme